MSYLCLFCGNIALVENHIIRSMWHSILFYKKTTRNITNNVYKSVSLSGHETGQFRCSLGVALENVDSEVGTISFNLAINLVTAKCSSKLHLFVGVMNYTFKPGLLKQEPY